MSKTTRKNPDGNRIMDFITIVAEKVGFKNIQIEEGQWSCVYNRDTGSIAVFMQRKDPSGKTVYFRVFLNLHRYFPLYLVTEFTVEGDGYLYGSDLLAHYGKTPAKFHDDHSDFKKDDISEFWTISCAKDIEALMRAYDVFAQIKDRIPVFKLPVS